MSGDIVERLRVDCECYDGDTCVHAAAADEIERLRGVEQLGATIIRRDGVELERLRIEKGLLQVEIERLRAASDALATNYELMLEQDWSAFSAAFLHEWQEARRG